MRRIWGAAAVLSAGLLSATAGLASAQQPTWVRGYPERGQSGCVEYVAQWSDGTFTSTPWDCGPGQVARRGAATAARGYPQQAANGCTEYVTQWSDGTYTWVPFSCPPGVVYVKPNAAGGPAAGAPQTLQPLQPVQPGQPAPPAPPAEAAPTAPLPQLQPVTPAPAPAPAAGNAANFREYVVQREGFAISIPANWVRIDPRETGLTDLPPEVFALFKFVASDASEDASLTVIKGPIRGERSIQAIFERNRTATDDGSTRRRTEIAEDEVSLPAGRALKTITDVTVTRPNGRTFSYRNVSFLVPAGDQLYILDFVCGCEPAAYTRFGPIFDQIARSLRFL